MSEPAATDDLELLRQFTRDHSQAAFTALVQRHVSLVYSAALRKLRSPQLAEDVTQSTFADLARNAAKLTNATGSSPVLAAWLYQVARHTAVDVIRKESRRQLREQIAVEMNTMNANAQSSAGVSPAWSDIEAHLDAAMAELDETDRAAVLLRYFENQSLRAVGQQLGVSDDAAQKRVSRAVERLREFFAKRGVSVGAGGLAVVISANAVQAAPVGLAVTISAAALAGTAATTSTLIAATKTIAMTTLQKTLVAATVAVLAGAGIYEARQAAQLRDQVQTLQQQQAPLAEQIQQLQRERDKATNRLAGLLAENSRLKSNPNQSELLKLRGEVGVLRDQLADAINIKKQSEQSPLATAREYYNRANQHSMNHEYEAQLEDLNKAIELDPNMADAYMERGNLYSMNLPNERGGDEKAVADYTRCLEIKPDDFSARWNRANRYKSLRQYDQAIADWTIIIQGDVDFSRQLAGKAKSIAGAYFWRGDVYHYCKRDYSKAIADFTAAIQMDPNVEYAHRSRGECYELLGETEKAQQDFAIEPKR